MTVFWISAGIVDFRKLIVFGDESDLRERVGIGVRKSFKFSCI